MAKTTDKKPKPKEHQSRAPRRNQPSQRQEHKKGSLNRIGALWISEGRNGKFMSGRIELTEGQEVRILVFKNGYKEERKHPDYIIYEPENENEQSGRSAAADNWKSGKGNATHTDDDIPF